MDAPGLLSVVRNKDSDAAKVDEYLTVYDRQKSDKERKEEFSSKGDGGKVMTNYYYNLATDFYEYGWGEGFHFSSMNKGESRETAFSKHECRLALKLGIKKGERVLVSKQGTSDTTPINFIELLLVGCRLWDRWSWSEHRSLQ